MTSTVEREKELTLKYDSLIGNRTAILGIGGAGCRIVHRIAQRIVQRQQNTDVDVFLMDSDRKELELLIKNEFTGPVREVHFGSSSEHVFAAKVGASLGEQESVAGVISGYDLALIVAELGKGTGSKVTLKVCDLLKNKETLTLVFAVLPFHFEDVRQPSPDYLERIAGSADTTFTIEDDRGYKCHDTHHTADENVIRCILMIINSMNENNHMGLDVSDLKFLFRKAGLGCFFTASSGTGQRDTILAERVRSQFLAARKPFEKVGGVMLLISGPVNFRLTEVHTIAQTLGEHIDQEAGVVFKVIIDESRKDVEAVFLLTGSKDTLA